jgi:hypothetical protein
MIEPTLGRDPIASAALVACRRHDTSSPRDPLASPSKAACRVRRRTARVLAFGTLGTELGGRATAGIGLGTVMLPTAVGGMLARLLGSPVSPSSGNGRVSTRGLA